MEGFKIHREPNAIVVELPEAEYGSLDERALERVRRVLLGLAGATGPPYLVMDMANVDFFAAGFIGVLVSTWKRLRERERRLAMCGLQPRCAKLVDVLRLWELFDIFPTRAAALRRIVQAAGARFTDERTVRIRIEKHDVPWDPNLVQQDYIADDNEPIYSVIVPRGEDLETLANAHDS